MAAISAVGTAVGSAVGVGSGVTVGSGVGVAVGSGVARRLGGRGLLGDEHGRRHGGGGRGVDDARRAAGARPPPRTGEGSDPLRVVEGCGRAPGRDLGGLVALLRAGGPVVGRRVAVLRDLGGAAGHGDGGRGDRERLRRRAAAGAEQAGQPAAEQQRRAGQQAGELDVAVAQRLAVGAAAVALAQVVAQQPRRAARAVDGERELLADLRAVGLARLRRPRRARCGRARAAT